MRSFLGRVVREITGCGGVHNINLVTPEHVVPQVVLSILAAKELGLKVPIVYNTSAFDSLESLELLDGLVDIYLPDFKVWKAATSKSLLKADDYASVAMESIKRCTSRWVISVLRLMELRRRVSSYGIWSCRERRMKAEKLCGG